MTVHSINLNILSYGSNFRCHSREGGNPEKYLSELYSKLLYNFVYFKYFFWIPAFAGMTTMILSSHATTPTKPRGDIFNSSFMSSIHNKLLLLFFLVMPFISYGQIIPTYSIDSITIKKLLPQIDATTLVLVNIDNTIITPQSKMFRYNNNPYIAFVDNLYNLAKSNYAINGIIASLMVQRQMMLVEPNWSDFINKMKSQGAMVFGFTEVTPPCKLINNFEGWKYSQLRAFNINFTDKVNNKEMFRFDDHDADAPVFYEGILFTGTASKLQTLIKFLKIIPSAPLKIVIFENNKTELKKIDSFLRMVDVEYYGIEYLGWQRIIGYPDEHTAKLQQDTLLKTGKWLEDAEAENFLKSQQENE